MLLAIDAGNTDTVFALLDKKGKIASQWRIATNPRRTSDEYAALLSALMAAEKLKFSHIKASIIASVVPQNLFDLKRFCRVQCNTDPLVIGDPDVKIPLRIDVDRPSEVGADRLANAVAAHGQYQSDAIVLDFGTATTFDIISGDGRYKGGLIAPGINLSLDALHRAAAKLPEIAIKQPEKVIATSTIPAMQSGIYWGYSGLIEGIVTRVKQEYGKPMTVIATGGLAGLFAKATPVIDHHEPDLTIRGLWLVRQQNDRH